MLSREWLLKSRKGEQEFWQTHWRDKYGSSGPPKQPELELLRFWRERAYRELIERELSSFCLYMFAN